MILSFNARDTHPRDKKVIDWYGGLYKSEKSRKIIDILHAHIVGNQHNMTLEVGESLVKEMKESRMEMVDITGGEELDLDSKLDLFGGDI